MAKQTFTTGQVLTAAQMTSLQQTAMGGGSTTAKTASYTLVAADAGTVVQMNSASATTITVNTALFAAGDTVQIQNIGAGVCTVTAGTATVNTAGSLALSQWEGGTLYFTSTSASIFFDLVQASGSTPALTKVQTSTLSAVANTGTTFDGVFTSTYKKYIVVFDGMYASGATALLWQFRISGTTRASGYYGAYNVVPYNGSITTTGTNNGTSCAILNLQNSTGLSGITLNVRGVGSSSLQGQIYGVGVDQPNLGPVWESYENNTAAVNTGFILSVASGTLTGTVTVYGLEN